MVLDCKARSHIIIIGAPISISDDQQTYDDSVFTPGNFRKRSHEIYFIWFLGQPITISDVKTPISVNDTNSKNPADMTDWELEQELQSKFNYFKT